MYKLGAEKTEGPEIKLPTSVGSQKKQENSRKKKKNIYFCLIGHTKDFDCVDHNKLWKILRDGNTRPPYLPPQKPVCRTRSNNQQQLEKLIGSKLGNKYVKAVYCHPAYLTSMQNTSCKMPDWMKNKLESRLPGEYQ